MPGPQPTIAILGSGAVGALLGAELTRAGVATTLVTRDASAEAINASGITVTSPRFGDHATKVDARTTLDEPVDILLVAVKAPQLADALKRVTAEPATVVPLLNGVDHLAALRTRFDNVVAGTVRVQAHRDGRTQVVHRAPFLTITLAQPGAPALEQALTQADVDITTGASEVDVLWAKLSRLAALALSTTAADAPLGDVRDTAEAVAREVVAVANAEGATIDADIVVAELRGLPDAASSSLRADITQGAPDHELDAVGGAVLRAARCHDLLAPHTAELVARVQRRAAAG
ncbi:2-dehydropantoate 2-reductase [Baekduia sp.]|jgi:2-dehydropantoate 2-reductase|uniref:ketopantoate reductase family protein n=1 Tax=Baekduia sp. TaxID=2600305 RepID=UPI002DF883BD|nr:2-dehydropantoate 2-reductase [Baekduia sp.]